MTNSDPRAALHSLNRAHRRFSDLVARRELVNVAPQIARLERSYLRIVQAWSDSIESKDRYTAGHCARVADYTCLLAQTLGFAGRDLTWLRIGALLHDIGKSKIDPNTLNKPGALDPFEWADLRRHTIVGEEIVADLGLPYDIRPMVRSHHERWDGTGYPDHLAGEQIPLIARILCIADVYDALTTTRSYHSASTPAQALALMESESGRTFDPQILTVFRNLIVTQQGRTNGSTGEEI
jgi:putative nucleotidyltransferase with HDIG domain